jgi:hypothetical protein
MLFKTLNGKIRSQSLFLALPLFKNLNFSASSLRSAYFWLR